MTRRTLGATLTAVLMCLALPATAAPAERAADRGRGKSMSAPRSSEPRSETGGTSAKRGGSQAARTDEHRDTAAKTKTSKSKPAKQSAPNGVANSGTIKVSAIGTPADPSNEPHPGCAFRVDLYGFRAAQYDLTISLHAPTGSGELLSDSITVTEDAQGNELNLTRTYDVAELLPASEDGRWHLRVELKKEGSPGNGAKTKMLWLECPAGDAAAADDTAGDADGQGVLDHTDRTTSGDTSVLGAGYSNTETAAGDAEVAGSGGLAFTGGTMQRLIWIALALLSLGIGFTLLSRSRDHG